MTLGPSINTAMAPPPLARSVRGWARQNERAFVTKVQGSTGFRQVLANFARSPGFDAVPHDALVCLTEELCRCCLYEADAELLGNGALAAAQAEAEALKKRLTDCNLSTMKQMASLRAGGHRDRAYLDDTIIFHEPLHYVDEATKELVLTLVCDKLRQLELKIAPQSLIDALERHARALASQSEGASEEELQEALAELQQARQEVLSARARQQEAEDQCQKLQSEAAKVRARLAETEQALVESRDREAALQAACAELEEKSARLQAEVERQHAELARQQAEIDRQRAHIDHLNCELEAERGANAALRAEVQLLNQRLLESVAEKERLQEELKQLQESYATLEAEAEEMREELRRRNNTRTHGTQTTLTGQKLDEHSAENKRLKVMLEELQMKLKELVDGYRRKFGAEAKAVAETLGITALLKEDTVFQRLYDDALHRVERLETLRAKVRRERHQCATASTNKSPVVGDSSAAAAAAAAAAASTTTATDGSLLAAVEQSSLRGLRKMFSGEDVATDPTDSLPPPPLQPPKHSLSSSMSLPMLHHSPSLHKKSFEALPMQSVTTLNLDFGNFRGRRSLRR